MGVFRHRVGTLFDNFRCFSACSFFGYAPKRLLGGLLAQKGRTWILPGGGRPSIRSRRRMFYEGRPVRQKVASETVSGDNFRDFGSFWELLGSTLRTLSRSRVDLSPRCVCGTILHDFSRKRVPPGSVSGLGAATCWTWVILHLGPWTGVSPCVFEHSARRVPAQPRGEVTFSDFSLQVSLQEPLG